ncbi:MAG: hypothetical protein ACYDEF_04045 [Methanosarcina sp.]
MSEAKRAATPETQFGRRKKNVILELIFQLAFLSEAKRAAYSRGAIRARRNSGEAQFGRRNFGT